jgi:mannan endo-1,4-beta-mannosidase
MEENMKKKSKVIMTVIVFLLLTVSGLTAQGFYVSNGRLYDANGNEFIIRGVSHPHAWYIKRIGSIADIASVGANAVRVVCSSGDRWPETSDKELTEIIDVSKGHRVIPILEVHDTTGYGEESKAATLAQAVTYWKKHKSVLDGQESYVIINIGNEPYGNNNTDNWVNDTISAIQSMRSAGFQHTLVVDAPNWGQDWSFTMRDNAQSIFDADPDGNTLLSIHMYGQFDTPEKVEDYISTVTGQGLPLIIGEFGGNHSDGDPDEDAIMSYARQYGIGWIAWSWSGNSDDVSYLDMVNDFDVNSKTSWGNRVISGADGLSSTSSLCSLFEGATLPPVTAAPTPVPTPEGNLALNQPVQASSSESGDLGPEKSVDGNQETRWASSTDANNWIYVDLGSTVDIERVIIFWETAYAVRYRLEVSDDTNNWTQIFEENNGDGDIDDITVSGTGRYLRMYGVERYNSEWGYSIWEWAVYGTGGATREPTPDGTPVQTPETETPAPTPGQAVDCSGVPEWNAEEIYEQAGMRVQYNGNLYENNWYSQNQNPEQNSGEYQVWTLIGPCDGSVTSAPTGVTTETPVPTQAPTPDPSRVLGDANDNGSVDIVDALLVAQFYVGLGVTINQSLGDVNCDNALDIVDALLIAQYYVGLIGEFPC